MAAKSQKREDLEVHLGSNPILIGKLHFSSGKRSAFSYDQDWLNDDRWFNVSPELEKTERPQQSGAVFFSALEDTAPDSWGERVIRRAHAKLRQRDRDLPPLDAIDFITWVNDDARVGALRLYDPKAGAYLRSSEDGRNVPPLVELDKILYAARALEEGTESTEDLQYLLGRGTSLGGARPKATVREADGSLWIGKFPSQADQRDVVRGEVLAMKLANRAGIHAAEANIMLLEDKAVAMIRRFDRTSKDARVPYISAATLIQATGRTEDHAYTELAEVLVKIGAEPTRDMQQLWRRAVFNFLVCNTDDHLHNTGFLFDARKNGWTLAPAFDINPMPGGRRESKTWLTEDSGPIDSKDALLEGARHFRLGAAEAAQIWDQVIDAVSTWQQVAGDIGMKKTDLTDFQPAFDI